MSKLTKILIGIGAVVLAIIIGLIDALTGLAPDITVLYLVPIIGGTIFIGLRFGLFVAATAAVGELVFHTQLGVIHGARLNLDVIFHFLVFTLVAILISRLFVQLRAISELEQKRSYDLDTAKEVRQSVFTSFPAKHQDLAIGARLAFASELGGDYCHFSILGERLFFLIADISGKSISAALFSALLHQIVVDTLEHSQDLGTIVTMINSRIYSSLPASMFVTLFCSSMDDRTLRFINAGHEPPLLYSKRQKNVKLLESRMALPVSIRPDLRIEPMVEPFEEGDILLTLTDGVTESKVFRDKAFEKLRALLRESSGAEPQDIADIVYSKAISDNLKYPLDGYYHCLHWEAGLIQLRTNDLRHAWKRERTPRPHRCNQPFLILNRAAYPPATAGMTEISASSDTSVPSPCRKRTSSSFT